jgi:formate dehydrogenase subunit gamma
MATQDGSSVQTARRIDNAVEAARAGGGDGLLLPALHAVQSAFGYVPDDAVAVLADRFNLSRADVHGVVTFYRDFTTAPSGRPRVRVCRAEACQAVGANALLAAVREQLGSEAVGEVFCLGNCALGPSVSVDGQVLGLATVARVVAAAVAGAVDTAGQGVPA